MSRCVCARARECAWVGAVCVCAGVCVCVGVRVGHLSINALFFDTRAHSRTLDPGPTGVGCRLELLRLTRKGQYVCRVCSQPEV